MSRISVTLTYAVYLLCTLNEITQFHGNRSACQVSRSIYTTYIQNP